MTITSRQRRTPPADKIPIIVADSQVLFRKGIQRIFAQEEDMDILGDTGEVNEALSQIKDLSPRIVLLDESLTPQHSLDVAEVIHRYHPTVSVILLTQQLGDQQIFQAMKAGVAAPLSRNALPEEMATTIRTTSQGTLPILEDLLRRPAVATLIQDEFRLLSMVEETSQPLTTPLTERESEILNQLAKGRTPEDVAISMNMKQKALRTNLASILIKLADNKQTLNTVAARQQG